MQKYSVITFNFNNYEVLKQIQQKSENCEYIYVTDDVSLKSKTWNIVLENEKLKSFKTPFEKCFYIRYHLFEFCNTYYCICLDGSMKIIRNLDKIMNDFINSNCDVGLMTHPLRNNIDNELFSWIYLRGYGIPQANNQHFFKQLFADYKDCVLYQLCMKICKNTQLNQVIDDMVFCFAKYLGLKNGENIDRLDQTIYSITVNHFFKDLNIFRFTQDLVKSSYINWCKHGTDTPIPNMNLQKLDNHYYIE